MAHCLLARDRAAGTVTVLSPASFDRGEDATDAARALVISGAVDPESTEILIVDLADASRLEFVILAAPVEEPVAEDIELAPAAGVWETPAEVAEEPEVETAPELTAESEPQPEPEPGHPAEPEAEAEPEPEPSVSPERALALEPEPERAPDPEPALEPEMPDTPEPQPEVAFAPEPEPLPWPSPEPMPAPAPLPSAPPVEETVASDLPAEPKDEPAPVEGVVIAEVTMVEALPVVELDVGPYEVSGELILERYTCEDCVYANTCPKVGESAPAECGSFQWKAL